MRTTHPYIQLPRGYMLEGKLPSDRLYEYVREFPDPLGILFDTVRLIRRDEQKARDNYEKLMYETKERNQETGG